MGYKISFFLAAIILSNIICISWMHHLLSLQQDSHPATNPSPNGFVGDVGPTWPTNRLPVVAMPIENSLRYQLNSSGDSEWAALFPNDGMIYLGSQRKPHTISMFHQLHCLDALRRHIMRLDWPQDDQHLTSTPAPEKHDLTQHCFEYLRQMVVCRADTALEAVAGKYAATREGVARCKDWRVVYDALRRSDSG